MTEEKNKLETWEEIIIDFFENKVKDIATKKPCLLYKCREDLGKKLKSLESGGNTKKTEKLKNDIEEKEKELCRLRHILC